jgi:cytochrome P450
MGMRFVLGKLRFLYRDRKWNESIKIVHAFIDRYVDKAIDFGRNYLAEQTMKKLSREEEEEEDGQRYVLLQEMAKETDNRDELRNQILHVLLAGHDSSGIAIGNAIFFLCRNPRVWEKLRAEVLAVGSNPFTFEGLKNMHYLQYVVRETLRLHPVAPTDGRMAYKDTVLPVGGGPDGTAPILVQKGEMVLTSFHALHRLAPCFQDDEPESFKPERWEKVRPGWAYLPFGGGVRMCPAHQLALTEVAYVLARMAQEFEGLECKDETMEWVEDLTLTASSRNGIMVGLVGA